MLDYQGVKFQEWLYKQFEKEKGKPISDRFNMKKAIEMLGVSKTNVYQYFKSKSLGRSTVQKIVDTFGVTENEIWGEEGGIKPNVKPALFKGNGNPNMWIVPIKAQGGFLEGYGDQVLLDKNIEKVYFPFIGQECFAFEIEGMSMLTEYMPGEYFVGTPVENFNHLVKGRAYVFQTIDGIILKEFVKIEDDFIYLR